MRFIDNGMYLINIDINVDYAFKEISEIEWKNIKLYI